MYRKRNEVLNCNILPDSDHLLADAQLINTKLVSAHRWIVVTKMPNRNCCVVNCKNTEKNNPNLKFYSFPRAQHKREQRKLWIIAVRRQK